MAKYGIYQLFLVCMLTAVCCCNTLKKGEEHTSGQVSDSRNVAPDCGSGWVNRPGSTSCYKFVVSPLATWANAWELCKDMGGYLATLETDEEIIWINGYRSYHKSLRSVASWIGGYKRDNVWYWRGLVADTPVLIFDWADGQPDNAGGSQDCLSLFGEFSSNGQAWFRFDDDTCNYQLGYMCEK